MIVFFCLKNNILLYLWNELILFKNKNSYLVRGKKQTFISQTFTFLERKKEKKEEFLKKQEEWRNDK